MGMAASQARYLALVARKSNCEYEGQQINQARTVLSNQSANLFNQMLGLSVPIPPSTQDYTKTQYSYTDGVNEVTMDKWEQLGTSDENYNYVVTYHYNSNVYTGSQKKMNDPQVQFNTKGTSTDYATLSAAAARLTSTASSYNQIKEDYERLKANLEAAQKALDEANSVLTTSTAATEAAQKARDAAQAAYNNAVAATSKYKTDSGYDTIKTNYETADKALADAKATAATLSNYTSGSITGSNTKITSITNGYKIDNVDYINYNNLDQASQTAVNEAITKLKEEGALDSTFNLDNVYYSGGKIVFKDDITKALGSTADVAIPTYTTGADGSVLSKAANYDKDIINKTNAYNAAKASYDAANENLSAYTAAETSAKSALDIADTTLTEAQKTQASAAADALTAQTNYNKAKQELEDFEAKNQTTIDDYNAAKAAYEALQAPEYIGNCKLTLLETLTDDQKAEIKQVVKDMQAQGINADINNCFDADGNYTGGIYQFTLNGKTYYSTLEGLYNSYNSGTGPNHIDGQTNLAYYNASYVSTKIEDTKKALLETDSNGRFTSIRMEDDTVMYTLSMETITDDAAYQDAMNQYYYENAQYDKMIQDINAKTSLIQQEDLQLELRLKQLDTEQNALSTEIDAVSKVVKDNVEKSFKTFGG